MVSPEIVLRKQQESAAQAREVRRQKFLARGGVRKPKVKTLTQVSWNCMKQRCLNTKDPRYAQYGGRGISVYPEWMEFQNFLHDMGERQPGTSIERIDANGNYEPSNCRWATTKEQQNNLRTNHLITWKDETLTVAQWAERIGMSYKTFSERIRRGWSIERAMSRPVSKDSFIGRRGEHASVLQ